MKKFQKKGIRLLTVAAVLCCLPFSNIPAEETEEYNYEEEEYVSYETDDTEYSGSDSDTEYDTTDSSETDYSESDYEESYYDDSYDYEEESTEESEEPAAPMDLGDTITTNAIEGWPQGPAITSGAAFVMEESSHVVLYSKNADVPLYPSSAVKIMTCLVALENSSLEDIVTMTSTGMAGVVDGATTISSQVDEEFTMEQCLYAITLASANEISLQVAEYVGGSVEHFVKMMNDKAKELGCTNTVFTNPTGLPDPQQVTTAHDLALITEAALADRTFQTISSTKTYTIPPTNVSGGQRVLSSNLTLIDPATPEFYEFCIGGKEGYTEDSGSVLACGAVKDDMRVISVVMRGGAEETDNESVTLLNYAFDNFELLDLGRNDFSVKSGGVILVPKEAGQDQITWTDTMLEDGTLDRQYQFSGIPIGTGIALPKTEQDNSIAVTGAAHLEEAKEYSSANKVLPYYLIAGAGALLMLFLAMRLVKILKSK